MSPLKILVDNLCGLSVSISPPLEAPADADDECESNEDDPDKEEDDLYLLGVPVGISAFSWVDWRGCGLWLDDVRTLFIWCRLWLGLFWTRRWRDWRW